MRRIPFAIALYLGVREAIAGCTVDENRVRHCTGLSWTARLWVYIGAAIAFVLCNILLVYFIRRYYRKKKARLPAAPGAPAYAPGEYWNQRRAHLPGYKPPEALLPIVAARSETRSSMSQTPYRHRISRSMAPVARSSSRTSEQPPAYEASPLPPALYRSDTESTLAEPARPPPVSSMSRTNPPVPVQGQALDGAQ